MIQPPTHSERASPDRPFHQPDTPPGMCRVRGHAVGQISTPPLQTHCMWPGQYHLSPRDTATASGEEFFLDKPWVPAPSTARDTATCLCKWGVTTLPCRQEPWEGKTRPWPCGKAALQFRSHSPPPSFPFPFLLPGVCPPGDPPESHGSQPPQTFQPALPARSWVLSGHPSFTWYSHCTAPTPPPAISCPPSGTPRTHLYKDVIDCSIWPT